ncbi:MAG: energy transducer TonB [Treponema sp.]|jgi:protein TonB|nr:energy transducer TonB [Treponema sp.]
MNRTHGLRALVFIAAAALHGGLICFLAFNIRGTPQAVPETAAVMKLADLAEERPPPPPPSAPLSPQNAAETVAEHFEETETAPQETAVPQAVPVPRAPDEEYLPMHLVSERPVFDEEKINTAVIYPPIARRSGIEGRVILELFVDREGWIRRVAVLREEPPGRGFGEAAARAFQGIRCVPARANDENVSARLRYPVTFKIK